MSELQVEPIDATLGAFVTGVRLALLTDEEWSAIHSAFLEHALLVEVVPVDLRWKEPGFSDYHRVELPK